MEQTDDAARLALVPPDSDGDGVEDGLDTFPLDASESVDTDSDGIGNNADPDDDGDGVDDLNDSAPLDSSIPAPLYWNFLNWDETKWH